MSTKPLAILAGGVLFTALLLPLVALLLSTSFEELRLALNQPIFWPAFGLSLKSTALSLLIVLIGGTPLAWWQSQRNSRLSRSVEVLVNLPIVVPPAVIGVALLMAYGRQGILGALFASTGVQVPFTFAAVVMAQVVVSAPFYVQAAVTAFRKVNVDYLIVARTLGASPAKAFFKVAMPIALPGLVAGASLSWARALGEFGATLLFAGNLSGRTQTMPLAIFTSLESDVGVAVAISLVLVFFGAGSLWMLRFLPTLFRKWEKNR